jgi:hypothetical protein
MIGVDHQFGRLIASYSQCAARATTMGRIMANMIKPTTSLVYLSLLIASIENVAAGNIGFNTTLHSAQNIK